MYLYSMASVNATNLSMVAMLYLCADFTCYWEILFMKLADPVRQITDAWLIYCLLHPDNILVQVQENTHKQINNLCKCAPSKLTQKIQGHSNSMEKAFTALFFLIHNLPGCPQRVLEVLLCITDDIRMFRKHKEEFILSVQFCTTL